jgi:hypothetical protein
MREEERLSFFCRSSAIDFLVSQSVKKMTTLTEKKEEEEKEKGLRRRRRRLLPKQKKEDPPAFTNANEIVHISYLRG